MLFAICKDDYARKRLRQPNSMGGLNGGHQPDRFYLTNQNNAFCCNCQKNCCSASSTELTTGLTASLCAKRTPGGKRALETLPKYQDSMFGIAQYLKNRGRYAIDERLLRKYASLPGFAKGGMASKVCS